MTQKQNTAAEQPTGKSTSELRHGWLLPQLLTTAGSLYGRWNYWQTCQDTQQLPSLPIPAISWVKCLTTTTTPAQSMVEACLNAVPQQGRWQGWDSWQHFDYVLEWLLYGLGHSGQPQLPLEPNNCKGASARLYQCFELETMLAWPYDYWGDILAINKYGRQLNFYPTPMPVVQLMVGILEPQPTTFVGDPCCGTGRMLLGASNYSVRLYGQDINPTVIKAALVNGYHYAPWLVRPLPFLDGEQYDPSQSATISNKLVKLAQGQPAAATYLDQTEHDTEQQWRFEPIKKRYHRPTSGDK